MGGESQPILSGGKFNHYNTTPPKETRVFPLFNNSGKTAIVTGGGAGIGLAIAEALAESGANVAIWYHGNKEAIDRAAEIEEEYGVKCPNKIFPDLPPFPLPTDLQKSNLVG